VCDKRERESTWTHVPVFLRCLRLLEIDLPCVCRPLLSPSWALLSIYASLLDMYRALLGTTRALRGLNRALLGVYKAFWSV